MLGMTLLSMARAPIRSTSQSSVTLSSRLRSVELRMVKRKRECKSIKRRKSDPFIFRNAGQDNEKPFHYHSASKSQNAFIEMITTANSTIYSGEGKGDVWQMKTGIVARLHNNSRTSPINYSKLLKQSTTATCCACEHPPDLRQVRPKVDQQPDQPTY